MDSEEIKEFRMGRSRHRDRVHSRRRTRKSTPRQITFFKESESIKSKSIKNNFRLVLNQARAVYPEVSITHINPFFSSPLMDRTLGRINYSTNCDWQVPDSLKNNKAFKYIIDTIRLNMGLRPDIENIPLQQRIQMLQSLQFALTSETYKHLKSPGLEYEKAFMINVEKAINGTYKQTPKTLRRKEVEKLFLSICNENREGFMMVGSIWYTSWRSFRRLAKYLTLINKGGAYDALGKPIQWKTRPGSSALGRISKVFPCIGNYSPPSEWTVEFITDELIKMKETNRKELLSHTSKYD